MSLDKNEILDEAISVIDDLGFFIPTYYQDFITRDIFKAVLDDRKLIKAQLERLKNEQ